MNSPNFKTKIGKTRLVAIRLLHWCPVLSGKSGSATVKNWCIVTYLSLSSFCVKLTLKEHRYLYWKENVINAINGLLSSK